MSDFWIRFAWFILALTCTIGLIAYLEDKKGDDEGIPVPPPGYHYCTNENATSIGFCRNTR